MLPPQKNVEFLPVPPADFQLPAGKLEPCIGNAAMGLGNLEARNWRAV